MRKITDKEAILFQFADLGPIEQSYLAFVQRLLETPPPPDQITPGPRTMA
jgi:hypothetical protein